jgi:hypothetical protein
MFFTLKGETFNYRSLHHGIWSAEAGGAENQVLTLFNSKEVSKYVLAGTGF